MIWYNNENKLLAYSCGVALIKNSQLIKQIKRINSNKIK